MRNFSLSPSQAEGLTEKSAQELRTSTDSRSEVKLLNKWANASALTCMKNVLCFIAFLVAQIV